uniref:Uncharacterized protein n=1 Tax=Lepeophtheirus salmonis TaxID=72036 RepID=A0A0K2UL41_LEPSM
MVVMFIVYYFPLQDPIIFGGFSCISKVFKTVFFSIVVINVDLFNFVFSPLRHLNSSNMLTKLLIFFSMLFSSNRKQLNIFSHLCS